MSNEDVLSRRGLFMKLGILFNTLVAAALAVPFVRFLLSSITRGRADAYLSWVPLGSVLSLGRVKVALAIWGCSQRTAASMSSTRRSRRSRPR